MARNSKPTLTRLPLPGNSGLTQSAFMRTLRGGRWPACPLPPTLPQILPHMQLPPPLPQHHQHPTDVGIHSAGFRRIYARVIHRFTSGRGPGMIPARYTIPLPAPLNPPTSETDSWDFPKRFCHPSSVSA